MPAASRLRMAAAPAALIGLGMVYWVLFPHLLPGGPQHSTTYAVVRIMAVEGLVFLAAVRLVFRSRALPGGLAIVLGFAVLFRLALLFEPPVMSSDIYRYVWDGRVQGEGINPYRYIPADPALAGLRDDDIYPFINRRETAPTIYPPVAQAIFFGVARIAGSVTAMKIGMVGFEFLAMAAAALLLWRIGQPPARVIALAWNPLLLWEFAGSGHVDAAMIAFMAMACLARWHHRPVLTGIALACAILVKPWPVALIPFLYRRWDWRMPAAFAATVVLAYLPYLGVGWRVLGYLPGYAAEEGIDRGSGFFLVALLDRLAGHATLSGAQYGLLAGAFLVALALTLVWRLPDGRMADGRRTGPAERWTPEQRGRFVAAAALPAVVFTVLASPHYPWYFAWLAYFCCFVPSAPVLYLTVASLIHYARYMFEPPAELVWLEAAIYGSFLAVALLDLLTTRALARISLPSDGQRRPRPEIAGS